MPFDYPSKYNSAEFSEIFEPFFAGNPNLRLCTAEDIECVTRTRNSDHTGSMHESCKCPYSCNAIGYGLSTTISKISPKHLQNFTSSGDFALESEVSVYFAQNEFVSFKRVIRSDLGTFLSHIGGFLWFFLGASALSIVEVIYFFTVRFFNNLWIE